MNFDMISHEFLVRNWEKMEEREREVEGDLRDEKNLPSLIHEPLLTPDFFF